MRISWLICAGFLVILCLAATDTSAANKLNTTTSLDIYPYDPYFPQVVSVDQTMVFIATVRDQEDRPVTSGQVKLCNAARTHCEDAAVLATAQLTATGEARVQLKPGPGTHVIQAVFAGTDTYSGSVSYGYFVTVAGRVPSATTLDVSGNVGDYTLLARVMGGGIVPPTGSVAFNDLSQPGTQAGTAVLDSQNALAGFFLSNFHSGQNSPDAPVIGDFNRDGNPDVVVANAGDNSISIYLGRGDGTLQDPQVYQVGSLPDSIAIGDLNGDGELDVAVANQASNAVSILLGKGDGTFQVQQTYATGNDPLVIAVADLNGDGNLDLVVTSYLAKAVDVLLGNGDGTFQRRQTYGAGAFPCAVAVADFDRNGTEDMVVANYWDGTVSMLLGNGDGTFQPQRVYEVGDHPVTLAVADFNGDGQPDVALVFSGLAEVHVLLGNGEGTFQAQPVVSRAYGYSFSMAVGDFNGDGIADLAFADNFEVSRTLGKGDGSFQAPEVFDGGNNPHSVAVGDLNGDGRMDLVVTDRNYNAVNVLSNVWSVQANLANVVIQGGVDTHVVIAQYPGDLNYYGGNSKPVNVARGLPTVLSFSANQLTVGVGGNVQLTATPSPNSYHGTTATGTVNFYDGGALIGQHPLDLSGQATLSVVVATAGNHVYTAAYLGDSTFLASTSAKAVVHGVTGTTTTLSISGQSVQIGNAVTLTATVVDSSGAPVGAGQVQFCDAAATFCEGTALLGAAQLTSTGTATMAWRPGPESHFVRAAYGGGAGYAGSQSNSLMLSVNGQEPSQTELNLSGAPGSYTLTANVTGGGSLAPTGTVTFLDQVNSSIPLGTAALASQSGSFGYQPFASYGNQFTTNLAVADFNNDGVPDVLLVSSVIPINSGAAMALLGAGDGTFKNAPPIAFQENGPFGGFQGVAIADVNGDGNADLIVDTDQCHSHFGCQSSIEVLLGKGDGTFTSVSVFGGGSLYGAIAVGDFNGDGKPDLAILQSAFGSYSSGASNAVGVFLGNGDGTFQGQQVYSAGGEPWGLVVGDFNGDGRLDWAITNSEDGTVSVLLGAGDGTFNAPETYATGSHPHGLATGDLNGDGIPDLAVANWGDSTVSVRLGLGDGTFKNQVTYATGSDPTGVAIGDFNMDGKPDLAVTNSADNTVSVLLGRGDGTFHSQQTYATGVTPLNLVAGDLNGDGALDLVVANNNATTGMSVLIQQWSQQAVLAGVSLPGNGDNHTVVAGYSGDNLYLSADSNPVSATSGKLTIGALNPDGALAGGGAFSLRVTGANFASGTVIQWNGSSLATTFTNSRELTASVPASLLGAAGDAKVTVAFGQFSSDPAAFSIVAPVALASSPTVLTVTAPGGYASATLTVTPQRGFSGTVSLSCTVGSSQGSQLEPPTCAVRPGQLSFDSPTALSASVFIYTSAPVTARAPSLPGGRWAAITGISIAQVGLILGFVPWRKRSRRAPLRRAGKIALLIIGCLSLLMIPACGGEPSVHLPGTRVGDYTVTVSAEGGNYKTSIPIPLTVQ